MHIKIRNGKNQYTAFGGTNFHLKMTHIEGSVHSFVSGYVYLVILY